MKKVKVLLLMAAVVGSMAACGGKTENQSSESATQSSQETTVESSADASTESTVESSEESTEEEKGENENQAQSTNGAVAILQNVWDQFGDDNAFPAAGGDMSEENMTMGGAGVYSLEDAEAVDASLGLPTNLIDRVDEAASLVHMMNANTFTGAAFHVKDMEEVQNVIAGLTDNIVNRQWVCGMPDKVFIASVSNGDDNYVISAFGEAANVDNFATVLCREYPNAVVAIDKDI